MSKLHALIAAAACLVAAPAWPASFCVNTVAEIQAAISEAQANNADDEIRLVGATYELTTGLHFQSEQSNAIMFRGGYNANCTVVSGASTTIDGQHQVRGLFVLNNNGDVAVEGLTFVAGLSTNNRGGGLRVISQTGDIRIDRNLFFANRADDFAGALAAGTTSGSLRVRNNLAFANSSANVGAMELVQNDGEAYVVGNTIVANSNEGDFLPGGLYIGGGANFTVSNNIIWNNIPEDAGPFDVDFMSTAASHTRIANDIGVVANGTVADLIVDEHSVDPEFASCDGFLCFNFELERSSPLVDAGNDAPAGGMTSLDLAGKQRTIGPQVDIGAYENDVLFADGFD